MTVPRLQAQRVGKRFPGVQALADVDLSVHGGEVVAVLGENGAGKSTLMKILAGVHRPDSGELLADGKPVQLTGVRHAEALGIALIHQELNLCANLSVGAAMFLGREPRRGPFLDERTIRKRAREVLDWLGLDVDPGTRIDTLSLGQQQMVEIARALAMQASVLIMDEPTSSLGDSESERLFAVIDSLRAQDVAVLYISHRLAEIERLADRVVVLRDGRVTGELQRDAIARDAMVRLMVGRDVDTLFHHRDHRLGPPLLQVDGLVTRAHPRAKTTFAVHRGEVVGLAGLVGSGRSEILAALFGVDAPLAGSIRIDGEELASGRRHRPRDAIEHGLALLPEDRKRCGLVLEQSVAENLTLPRLARDARCGWIDGASASELVSQAIANLRIATAGADCAVRDLSGGNQQKVVLGKWLAMQPRLLLLDEPTRGIDVGAKAEIYALIDELAANGTAILFVSSELDEVLGVADRILVLRDGAIVGELRDRPFEDQLVMRLAAGGATVHPEQVG